jgi:gamma-glutamyl hercynylcysteine S-oxide synthase
MAYSPATSADSQELTEALADARERTFALIGLLDDCALERVHSRLMSPLVWDLGHIAAFEDLWLVHRFGGEDMVRRDLAEVYDAFETPRAGRGDLPFLGPDGARDYLAEVRERSLAATERLGPGDGTLHELVVRHEHQHNETMLQTIMLARLDCLDQAAARPAPRAPGGHSGLEMVHVPGGEAQIGAPAVGFAYDNERPRHRVELPSFQIGRTPVSNATWLSFSEGGGYERREWWTDEAWHWKEEYDITHPLHWDGDGQEWIAGEWQPLDPDKPVAHVSWFEADAFARAHGARLPTEFEWERAATWDQDAGRSLDAPWGSEPWSPERANLDQLAYGTEPVGARPQSMSPSGCLGMLGDLWEWTASPFDGYPGFRAHPYREYSEVFFGGEYRVLRGGSWATRPRVATPTFRNWDYPQRRQIFSGVRIARDA